MSRTLPQSRREALLFSSVCSIWIKYTSQSFKFLLYIEALYNLSHENGTKAFVGSIGQFSPYSIQYTVYSIQYAVVVLIRVAIAAGLLIFFFLLFICLCIGFLASFVGVARVERALVFVRSTPSSFSFFLSISLSLWCWTPCD